MAGAFWTDRIAVKIFPNRKPASASAAHYRKRVILTGGPNLRFVIRQSLVAIETRIPLAAALEFDRNYVESAVIMLTSRLGVDIYAEYLFSLNQLHRFIRRAFIKAYSI